MMKRSALSQFAFFVECDGKRGHAETAQQVIRDDEREQAIRRETGMPVLRFSSAECIFQQREVHAVIAAQVEAMAALREYGDSLKLEANAVLAAVASLAAHRALRTDYTARNYERSTVEPYDEVDPFGDWDFPSATRRAVEWDRHPSLRLEMARLYHAVARARRDEPGLEGFEPHGKLRPFHEVVTAVVENLVADHITNI